MKKLSPKVLTIIYVKYIIDLFRVNVYIFICMFNYYTFMEDYLLCHVMKDTQKLFPTEL